MKRSIMLIGALVISSAIFAQKRDKHPGAAAPMEKLRTELSLDDQQFATIKGINKKYAEQFSQLRNDSTADKGDKRVALKDLRNKRANEINAVLTPNQKTKLEKLKADRAEKRKDKVKFRNEQRQAQMAKVLSLTDDQALKVKEANKTFVEKAKVVREQSRDDKNATKEAMKNLRKEHESAMQSILTKDQFAKWKDMRKTKMQGKKGRKH